MKLADRPDVVCLTEPSRAAALMHPLRLALLGAAREETSASEMAARFGMARQRVNYHVRALEAEGLLVRAGRRRKRNMIEQRYVAAARAWVLSPELLGDVAADCRPTAFDDRFSSATLLALGSQLLRELGRARAEADAATAPLATLSVASEFRFRDPEERSRFTRVLEEAVLDVVARFTSPFENADGSAAPGRPYRLLVGCWPVPSHPNPPEHGDACS